MDRVLVLYLLRHLHRRFVLSRFFRLDLRYAGAGRLLPESLGLRLVDDRSDRSPEPCGRHFDISASKERVPSFRMLSGAFGPCRRWCMHTPPISLRRWAARALSAS